MSLLDPRRLSTAARCDWKLFSFPQDMIFSDEEVEQDSGRSEAEEDAEPEHSPNTDAIPPVSMK